MRSGVLWLCLRACLRVDNPWRRYCNVRWRPRVDNPITRPIKSCSGSFDKVRLYDAVLGFGIIATCGAGRSRESRLVLSLFVAAYPSTRCHRATTRCHWSPPAAPRSIRGVRVELPKSRPTSIDIHNPSNEEKGTVVQWCPILLAQYVGLMKQFVEDVCNLSSRHDES